MYEKLHHTFSNILFLDSHHTSNNILFLDSPVNRLQGNMNRAEIFVKHFDSLSKTNAKEKDPTKLVPRPLSDYWNAPSCYHLSMFWS